MSFLTEDVFNFCSNPTGILTCAILTLILYVLFQKWRDPLIAIPGPIRLPIVGYFPFLGAKMHLTLTDLWRQYGDVFRVQIGARQIVVLNGQRALKEALLKSGNDFAGRPDYISYQMSSKESIVGLNDFSPRYRVGKKLLLKAFGNFASVRKEEMQKLAHDAAKAILEEFQKDGGSPSKITNERLYPIVSVIMGYISWGTHFDQNAPEIQHILTQGKEFATTVMFGVICDYFPWAKFFMKKQLARLKHLFHVQQVHAYRLAEQHVNTYDGKNLRDIADFFQKVSEEMTDEEKRNLKITDDMLKVLGGANFGAGFGTITITLRWAMLLLAKHPEHQNRMQQELDHVIGRESLPTFDDARNLPFSMAVINEIYRYSSLAAIPFAHKTICDTEVCGHIIPKNTIIICNLYSLHRDPKIFANPDSFNPERFLNNDCSLDKVAMENVAAYGLGTRRCAGEVVARLEIFTLITALFHRCHFEEVPEEPLDLKNYRMTLALDPLPFVVKITPR